MLLSLQRRQRQEEEKQRKLQEIKARREREKAKEEEKARKKEEQAARRAAILEQHRLKKAIEEAEKEVSSITSRSVIYKCRTVSILHTLKQSKETNKTTGFSLCCV